MNSQLSLLLAYAQDAIKNVIASPLLKNPPKTLGDFSKIIEDRKEKRLSEKVKKHYPIPEFQNCRGLVNQQEPFFKSYTFQDSRILGSLDVIKTPETETVTAKAFNLSTRGIFFPQSEPIQVSINSKTEKKVSYLLGFTEDGAWLQIEVAHDAYTFSELYDIEDKGKKDPPFFREITLSAKEINTSQVIKLMTIKNESLAKTTNRFMCHIESNINNQVKKLEDRLSIGYNFLVENAAQKEIFADIHRKQWKEKHN